MQLVYVLPFESVHLFGPFFTALQARLGQFDVSDFSISITSLEDVFLKIGEDHTVTPSLNSGNNTPPPPLL